MTEVNRERESRNRSRSSGREEGQRLGIESRDRDGSREREKVGPLQDLHLVSMSILTGTDLDAIDVVSMIILQENALML